MPNMLNHEVFTRDPIHSSIPNDGVASLTEPKTDQEWNTLRFELESFVCEGQYHQGLQKILGSFQRGLDSSTQAAVWVSGFYGSGKSHLVRVLEHLWRNLQFKDRRFARDMVHLPDDLKNLLRELETEGRRQGGLWAAAGTLGAGTSESIRLAVLGIIYRAAGLPMSYSQARFILWLKETMILESVQVALEARGKTLEAEATHLFVSPVLAEAVLNANPKLAESSKELRELFKNQFPQKTDVDESEFSDALQQVLKSQSRTANQLPLTLLVLDELQQYVNEDADRMFQVQTVIESVTKTLGSRLLVVATGQSAMQASPQLQKLQARFTVQIPLQQSDVQYVLRKVILAKKPDCYASVQATLEHHSGEIDRQLSGTQIAPNGTDKQEWVADYPLLPARKRFWDAVIQAVDRTGTNAQLRNQLRMLQRSLYLIAKKPLGWVIPADAIYYELRDDLKNIRVLLPETDETIYDLSKDKSAQGMLASRLVALCFLMTQLSSHTLIGLRATQEILADLLIEDLGRGSELRQAVPPALEQLVSTGKLVLIEGEYKLQTVEGRQWDAQFRTNLGQMKGNVSRVTEERNRRLQGALSQQTKNLTLSQGDSKTPRNWGLDYGSEPPVLQNDVPIWVRDGWNSTESEVKSAAVSQGLESPMVTLFIPKVSSEELKSLIEEYLAYQETLYVSASSEPSTPGGKEAKAGMNAKKELVEGKLNALLSSVIVGTRVFQAGGSEIAEGTIRESLQQAANAALSRLYKDFKVADYAKWGDVFNKAKDGNANALEQIGFSGDPKDQAVCKQILKWIGAGKSGKEITKHFSSAPFGYPKDALHGSLLVLLLSGDLKATSNGQPIMAKQLDHREIEKVDFKTEQVVITVIQKIELRKLFQNLGVAHKDKDDLLTPAELLLEKMQHLKREAGGEAPAPVVPQAHYLEELKSKNGNDLLSAILDASQTLTADFTAWTALKDGIEKRLGRWKDCQSFFALAQSLAVHSQVAPQLEALKNERALLREPDPIPTIIRQLQDALRQEVLRLTEQTQEVFTQQISNLEAQGAWQDLSSEKKQQLLLENNLEVPKSPDVSTEQSLRFSLQQMGLDARKTQMDALPARFAKAFDQAVKLSAPSTVQLKLPTRTLRSSQDVKTYLAEIEEQMMQHISEGKPVMIG